jgi:hypothetical protein
MAFRLLTRLQTWILRTTNSKRLSTCVNIFSLVLTDEYICTENPAHGEQTLREPYASRSSAAGFIFKICQQSWDSSGRKPVLRRLGFISSIDIVDIKGRCGLRNQLRRWITVDWNDF